jgi:hypothetical protein
LKYHSDGLKALENVLSHLDPREILLSHAIDRFSNFTSSPVSNADLVKLLDKWLSQKLGPRAILVIEQVLCCRAILQGTPDSTDTPYTGFEHQIGTIAKYLAEEENESGFGSFGSASFENPGLKVVALWCRFARRAHVRPWWMSSTQSQESSQRYGDSLNFGHLNQADSDTVNRWVLSMTIGTDMVGTNPLYQAIFRSFLEYILQNYTDSEASIFDVCSRERVAELVTGFNEDVGKCFSSLSGVQ